jgi:acyl-CoA thioesterase II
MSGNETQKHPLVTELEQLLTVHRMGDGWYLGMRKPGGKGRVFGGQVIAQALAAAQDTVGSERIAHSLHAYFMRAGDEDYEITFRVERDFDGGTFPPAASSRCKRIARSSTWRHRSKNLKKGCTIRRKCPTFPRPRN